MRKIKFTLATNKVGSEVSKVIEVDDDTTDEEIDEMYFEWVNENNYGGWSEIE
jgi:hypothetical protein